MPKDIVDLPPETLHRLNEFKSKNTYSYQTVADVLGFDKKTIYNIMVNGRRITAHNLDILNRSLNSLCKPGDTIIYHTWSGDEPLPELDAGDEVVPVQEFTVSHLPYTHSTTTMIEHMYNLRDDVVVKLILPKDITRKELSRLELFIESHVVD